MRGCAAPLQKAEVLEQTKKHVKKKLCADEVYKRATFCVLLGSIVCTKAESNREKCRLRRICNSRSKGLQVYVETLQTVACR
jgi:hypothetical protein